MDPMSSEQEQIEGLNALFDRFNERMRALRERQQQAIRSLRKQRDLQRINDIHQRLQQ